MPDSAEKRVTSNRQKELRKWLENEIVEGRLAPGDKVDEQEICRKFGVSRTPVREALLQLAELELIAFRRRQGAIVTRMSVRQIVAMWEVLTNLEGLAAALAARRMTNQERDQLKAAYEKSESFVAVNDVTAYDQANSAFHSLIHIGCKNDYLTAQVRDIRSRTQVYRRSSFHRAGRLAKSSDGHALIMEAIWQGDDKRAEEATRDHIAGGLSVLDLVAELPG